MGYVGPGVVSQLRATYPGAELIGFDTGYFAKCLTNPLFLPENKLSRQEFGDVRAFPDKLLEGVDGIVYLAAISNDPMGNKYEDITMDVNYRAAVQLAKNEIDVADVSVVECRLAIAPEPLGPGESLASAWVGAVGVDEDEAPEELLCRVQFANLGE